MATSTHPRTEAQSAYFPRPCGERRKAFNCQNDYNSIRLSHSKVESLLCHKVCATLPATALALLKKVRGETHMKRKRTGRKRTKQEIVNLIFNIYVTINCAYFILMLILGEDIVMGNPVLRAIFDSEPCIFIVCTLLYAIASFVVWLWDKKHPTKKNDPLLKNGDRRPPTD